MSTARAARPLVHAACRSVRPAAAATSSAATTAVTAGARRAVAARTGKRGVASAAGAGFDEGQRNHQRFHQHHGYAMIAASALTLASLSLALSEKKSLEGVLPLCILKKLREGGFFAPSFARIEEFYTIESEDTLGRGQFGSVSTAVDKATGEVVAVKCIPRTVASEAHFRQEAEVHLEASGHPNVVRLKGVFADEECWYMVMELAEGGELFDRLTTEGLALEDGEVRSLLRDTAEAIAYLHDRSIVHGDVKPENMLLTAPITAESASREKIALETVAAAAAAAVAHQGGKAGSEEGVCGQLGGSGAGRDAEGMAKARVGNVLLADFGSSFRMREGDSGECTKTVKEYTVAYSAPEVVNNSHVVDQKVDVWSLGVVAYVMVKGHHPFDPTSLANDEEIADSILHSEPDWDGVEPKAASLIRRMLSRNPQDRPSAREVLQSSWLNQLQ